MKDSDFFTIFIFPFKYEMADLKELKPDDIGAKLHRGNRNPEMGWALQHYTLDTVEHYNEFNYFHPFVRQVIFNKKENSGMEYLTRTDFKYLEVEYYHDENKKISITTAVKSIDIHLFDNQVGLLTITTEKREEDEETGYHDFLRYNDIARRVYPPYLAEGDNNTDILKQISRLIPSRVTLFNENSEDDDISECFEHINLNTNPEKDILYLSKIIQKLLCFPFESKETLPKKDNECCFELKENQNIKKKNMDEKRVYYTPFTDDRMFIVSYYSDTEWSEKLTKQCCGRYNYETSDNWYRFVFVDGTTDAGIANDAMKRDLIQRHTYPRWQNKDSGILFGMSRYSFVLLCGDEWFPRNVLKQHMKSMYYQIALIVLFQRAMLLKFSEDITELTERFEEEKFPDLREDASKLHGDFIRFINKYWFVDVTPQEQGGEIYNQWIGLLNLEKLFSEVQKEISQLAEYIENRIESERNRIESERNEKLGKITVYGFPLVVVGLIVSFWQIYEININQFNPWSLSGWKKLVSASLTNSFVFLLIALVVSVILTILFIRWKFKNKK